MKTDARNRVWIIERCLASKHPLRRIWTAKSGAAFSTRRRAMQAIRDWRLQEFPSRHLYRATKYAPAPR